MKNIADLRAENDELRAELRGLKKLIGGLAEAAGHDFDRNRPGWEADTAEGDIRLGVLRGRDTLPRAELIRMPPDLGKPPLLQMTVLSKWAGLRRAVCWFPLDAGLEAQKWAEGQLELLGLENGEAGYDAEVKRLRGDDVGV